jgi:hypothetical protein
MSISNNLLYTRIYYRLWDQVDYQFKGLMIDQLDHRLSNRINKNFAFQRDAGLSSQIYSQLKEDHEYS